MTNQVANQTENIDIFDPKNITAGTVRQLPPFKPFLDENTLRNDRYTPTIYQEEKKALDSGLLSNVSGWLPDGCQVVASLEPQHNLTKHNITEQRKDIMSDKSDDVKTVIDYLNQKNGTSYRASSKKNKSLINARFSEGYSVDDFKKVIDIKTDEWSETDMAKFIRPETLFGNKFDGAMD